MYVCFFTHICELANQVLSLHIHSFGKKKRKERINERRSKRKKRREKEKKREKSRKKRKKGEEKEKNPPSHLQFYDM